MKTPGISLINKITDLRQATLLNRAPPAQVISYEFCEIFKNTGHLRWTASGFFQLFLCWLKPKLKCLIVSVYYFCDCRFIVHWESFLVSLKIFKIPNGWRISMQTSLFPAKVKQSHSRIQCLNEIVFKNFPFKWNFRC